MLLITTDERQGSVLGLLCPLVYIYNLTEVMSSPVFMRLLAADYTIFKERLCNADDNTVSQKIAVKN